MLVVIVGPPCAGKSTYAWRMAQEGDVVVDFDMIAFVLNGGRAHDAAAEVADVASAAWGAAVRRVMEKGYPAFVIHARPDGWQVDEYKRAGARFVLLDPGMGECLRRAVRDGRPPGTAEMIRDWYERPPDLAADWRETT